MATNLSETLDKVIAQSLANQRLVGGVILIAHKGRLIYEKAVGWKDREAQKAMHLETAFRLSSVTKPFVTVAALKLVEQGVISLDTPVTRWLPYFKPTLPETGEHPVITLHHLLTHQAGLSYGFALPKDSIYHRLGISDGIDYCPTLTLDENMRRLALAPLFYSPEEKWDYSLAIDVVGAMLENICDRPLPNIIEKYITAPLGLESCRFWGTSDVLATPYYNADPMPKRMRIEEILSPDEKGAIIFSPRRAEEKTAYPSGGAGMVGNAPDILRFLEIIRLNGDSLLKKSSVDRMFTNHVGAKMASQKPGFGFGYGGSLIIDPQIVGTGQSKNTLQWGGVYGHRWFIDRQQSITAVILTNTTFEGMAGQLPQQITEAIYQHLDS
ncbi:MAG: serine hydrolase domain-containing protein [Zymomonas mobilis subsp. pomaceae]|uniref:Beta-lactamase n=1 Tax=Zymomonas mobilis subsp. pomaceae (strain ATCC 29192 / DSM 22645 / JCM 10191 / CCUG 17912 / NBRC 13757 / NCIMB 11200 / NRRL B-4491 / Barker I) TaxID=579138 RepID=F8EVL8_ZYMMT|nr:serine hydrolase domain-containing protein [Zymomonas mobilis]AEI38355.1 beta-lactamase [Zymomonas mobilis subsp. pomaceae ATCC 29192]MDX5948044.1 serine hydrolase domain-containing protein [Zymomonas mobilis subsp. pomaceae]GEB89374.1 esterase [Zymomonas mobilis subsp. pomaceae]